MFVCSSEERLLVHSPLQADLGSELRGRLFAQAAVIH
jgi:hypothetical protein